MTEYTEMGGIISAALSVTPPSPVAPLPVRKHGALRCPDFPPRPCNAQDLGGAEVHSRISGVTDHFAQDDGSALEITRSIVSNLNRKKIIPVSLKPVEEPIYPSDEI